MTKNEPDYRLFLIRILSNLTKLDDRPVRESEQQTAAIHFSQNKKWTRFQNLDRAENGGQNQEKPKYKNDRAEYVKKVSEVLIIPWVPCTIFKSHPLIGSQIFSSEKEPLS